MAAGWPPPVSVCYDKEMRPLEGARLPLSGAAGTDLLTGGSWRGCRLARPPSQKRSGFIALVGSNPTLSAIPVAMVTSALQGAHLMAMGYLACSVPVSRLMRAGTLFGWGVWYVAGWSGDYDTGDVFQRIRYRLYQWWWSFSIGGLRIRHV